MYATTQIKGWPIFEQWSRRCAALWLWTINCADHECTLPCKTEAMKSGPYCALQDKSLPQKQTQEGPKRFVSFENDIKKIAINPLKSCCRNDEIWWAAVALCQSSSSFLTKSFHFLTTRHYPTSIWFSFSSCMFSLDFIVLLETKQTKP